ncbi:YciI family protein [Pollutimonas sp. H1-120]|uniref:YciI family protein n=1 Tax=Pollutimonas sp. H1-120 TaxID=3148824 RepID=UPI003B51B36F
MADMRSLYLIYAEDVSESEAIRAPLREEHIKRRALLHEAGRVVVSGPLVSSDADAAYSGSLMVAEFASLDEARQWAMGDPYVQGGVYKNIVVKRINTHFLK